MYLFFTRVIIQLQYFCASYVGYSSLCLNFRVLSCTCLLIWVHVTGRNTALTVVALLVEGAKEKLLQSCLNQ